MSCNIWKCKSLPLPEVLSFIVDNRGKTVPTSDYGHILIATNCIRNENLYPSYEKVRYLTEETYINWFRSHPLPGDILFVCKGTPGRTCMVPEPVNFCIAQDMVALRVNSDIVYNKYLLAVLRSYRIQKQIESTSVGDVIPHFKKSFFNQLMIPVPSMETQRIIGDYYFAFSYKIECNRKISENLEQQAQALFKSWLDNKIDNGGISVLKLTDVAEYINGLAMQKFPPTEEKESLPVLKIKELGQKTCDQNSDRCSNQIDCKYIVNDGDIIFSWSGTLLVDIWCGSRCGLNQHLFKVVPKKGFPKWFVYYWTKHHLDKFIRIAQDKAVTMGHIKRGDLDASEVIMPTSETMEKMNRIMQPMVNAIIESRLEISRLTQLRDTLLPKLMSGELQVKD